MKIGLNGQKILIENPAGPEKYTLNLFQTLAKIDKENNYVIYFDKEPEESFFKNLTEGNERFSYKVIKSSKLWTQFGLAKELIKNPVDVFFTAVHTIPMIRNEKTKYVTMIHGLEYKYTKDFKNPINRFKVERPIKYAVKNSDKIIVPTKATKDKILKKRWVNDDSKIEIINEGIADVFYRRSEDEVNIIREKYKIENNPYLLFVSTIQPRKNIPNMVEAFGKVLKENTELKNTKLLIAGKKGWDYEDSLNAPQKFGVEKNVNFIGRVPDEDLPILFSGSIGHINVSFEEGFGLPLVESMACGTQSVVSDIPAYREVGDNLPIYVNPNDVESIKMGILDLIKNEKDDQYKNLLVQRSKLFSWEKTAEKTLEVFQKIN